MRSRTVARAALLAFAAQAATGCSWIFMERAPDPVVAPDYPVQCTSSRVAPIVDSLYAGSMAVGAVVFAAMPTCGGSASTSAGTTPDSCVHSGTTLAAAALYAGAAAVYAVAANQGFKSAGRCEDLKGLNALCITGHEDACVKLDPAWTPARRPAPQGWQPVPAAPGVPGVDVPVPAAPGCTRDLDCKGARVCERGVCVEPR
jgi:hypothetical protein